ncbi:apolipoprotein N-acyltransferase [Thetidibacter halocola]|uniref:Apolipoprotein N-acyltransferase n=1 Tax=Thetidibacter halocola TaxID=2827239 RepID=A0A8J7WFT5_9RHOB|nr:apolipoprotein N-acyltransferase [Thetidibacter halocola]MBS0124571.1 apolipoprotein N-acyltransferase [Thetidibacter halocola]
MALGVPPLDLWPLALAGLVGAFLLFALSPPGTRASTGWMVGIGYFGAGLNWIVEPFMVDAPLTGWMAPFALVGMAAGLALFWALAFWLAGRARHGLAALAVAWAAVELVRAYVLTGFPWGLVGYLWLESPAIQWVSVIGPHGLTLATLVLAACLAGALRMASLRQAGLATALLALLLGGGWALTPPMQDLSGRPVVRLVQPNAPQREKWDPAMVPVFFERQVAATEAAPGPLGPPALVVWPETAVPVLLHRAADALAVVSDVAGDTPVILGIQRGEGGLYYNSLALIDGTGALAAVYDKHHLVPFGEYMPAPALWRRIEIGGLAARAEGGYSPGPGPRLLDLGPLGRALPLICYEAVFPQDVNAAPARPDWLLQLTNDAWFGSWSGPYQHLAQARIRAIEQGLPLLRAANTGVSAVIDGAGRVLDALPLNTAGHLDVPLPAPARETIYAYSGDLLALLALIAAAIPLVLAPRRERR